MPPPSATGRKTSLRDLMELKLRRRERQIAATDKQIDQLMCELYGLTEDKIRIVEGGQR